MLLSTRAENDQMRTLPRLALLCLLATAAFAAPACARREVVLTAIADTEPEVRGRAATERIAAGVNAGLIDPAEAQRLVVVMERIHAYQVRAYGDGVLSLREQARLRRFHARLDRVITASLSR